jgi:hypothetical protein
MIEIFLLYQLCKGLGRMLRAKGQPAFPFQFLLVVGWFTGEALGGFAGYLIDQLVNGAHEGVGLLAYLCALVAAATAAGLMFVLAKVLPNRLQPPPAFPVQAAAPVPVETVR